MISETGSDLVYSGVSVFEAWWKVVPSDLVVESLSSGLYVCLLWREMMLEGRSCLGYRWCYLAVAQLVVFLIVEELEVM